MAGADMWFGALGPLLVRDGDAVIAVAARRQRVLLAALLVRAGTVVPADALAEAVWDGAPPAGAETTLRSHVSRLRRVLGPAAGARVVTRYPGYLLQAGEEEVDLLRFRRLCGEGGAAVRERDWAEAWQVLGGALGLWRGEPLADVPSGVLRRDEVPGLEALRLQAVEWQADAGLQLGRHGELVAELQSLAAAHPLRERLHGQLMLALVRCGRQAEALEAYQRARAVLIEELGAEPGAGLRGLHQQILAADPALAVPQSAPSTASRAAVVPRELPAPAASFVGRGAELAALSGLLDRPADLDQARRVLDALARAHLIQPAGPGRYGLHDLLRAYARELAARRGEEEQHNALTRLFDHYLHTASMAMDTVYPAERHRRPRISPSATPVPPVTGAAAGRAWLDAERAALMAVTVHAAGHGWPAHATRLSETLFRYLDHGGHYPEAITIYNHARAAARRTRDRAAEVAALNYLGAVHYRQSRYQQAADHLREAPALFPQAGDLTAQGRVLGNIGNIHHHLGRYQEAIGFHRQALAIFDEIGDPFGKATALVNLGLSEERLGRYDLAARHHRQALAIAVDIGARELECVAMGSLGTVGLRQGRYRRAAGHLDRYLALCREIGHRDAEADALARTGDVCLRQIRTQEAAAHLRQALALYREIGNRSGEADALNSLGEVLFATGRPDQARAENAAALRLTMQVGDTYQQARAHHGLGEACRAGGDPGEARRHWQQALALFTELGTPEAGQVRAQLSATEDDRRKREARR